MKGSRNLAQALSKQQNLVIFNLPFNIFDDDDDVTELTIALGNDATL